MNRKRWWYVLLIVFVICMGLYVKKLVHIFPRIVQMYTGTMDKPMSEHLRM